MKGATGITSKETQINMEELKITPTLCFATMCKNEEHCIRQTLESVYKFIDYWIVCDTGSTDATCDIVRDFFNEKGIPGELHVDEWQGFDKNKTLMMQRAYNKADYVMHLDADDLLIGDYRFEEEDEGKDAYFVPVKRGGAEWKALIVFNNRIEWKFCGVAHTIIKSFQRPNGYSTHDLSKYKFYVSGEGIGSRSFDPKKYFYDAEKLQKQFFDTLVDDPDGLNTRSVFYTAQSYMDYGMTEEALKWNSLYLKLKNTWIEEAFEAQMRISRCYMILKADPAKIESEMQKAIDIFSDRSEPYYYLGTYFNSIGEHYKAYRYLKTAQGKDLDYVKTKYILFVNEKCYGKWVNDELSVACYWTDQTQEGISLINEILDDPNFGWARDRMNNNLSLLNQKVQ
jgi:glycosyltransferase involved in cell wall biosynthesis